MRQILVAFDDSASSERVTEFVNRFFGGLDVSVTAVNVARDPVMWRGYPTSPWVFHPWPYPAAGPAADAAATAGAVDETREAGERMLAATGVDADHEVVEVGGDVADTLRRVAEERGVDLIVVGSSHKGVLERLLSPSVSAELAKSAPTPVLVVH
jgi:nucleotide-binding universal stress UspA family protein